jgi:tRNA(Arg) A34 adenosine deaminase TadA
MPDLSEPERACLALAWEAMLAGTNPVGAVVVDGDGTIVASGRNAVHGSADPALLSASRLAHAEVNALLRLPVGVHHEGLRLVTSLEPCQMCTGAARMATVGALTFIGADPVNGTAWALAHDRYVGHRPVQVTGPRPDTAGRLASALAFAFVQVRKPSSAFVAAFRERRPDLAAGADDLIAAGLMDLVRLGAPWAEAAPGLLAAVEPA